MRFDDRLSTLLTQPAPDAAAKAALWTQLVDVMTQVFAALGHGQRSEGLDRLRTLRSAVPQERRRQAADSLSWQAMPAEIVMLFGEDAPRIASPVIARAQLSDEEWLRIIPAWPVTSRALLRERRDLPADAQRLLSAYGQIDMALPGEAGVAPLTDNEPIQIRDLVARIEAYRRDHHPPPLADQAPVASDSFHFECDADGVIDWVEGAPRGPLIGTTLAEMAVPGGYGADGQVAGAYRKRAAFRDARLRVPGIGAASGHWLISADPLFESSDGRFIGYRGVARRPSPSEGPGLSLLGEGLNPDSVRQLAHELRTPLNAVRGFGEMIESRMLGPVGEAYRERAKAIVIDAARLLAVIDDLDSAAKLQSETWSDSDGRGSQMSDLLRLVTNDLRSWIDQRGVRLRIAAASELPRCRTSAPTVARLMEKLLSLVVGLAGDKELIEVGLDAFSSFLALRVARPLAMTGVPQQDLLSAVALGDGGEPPGLGVGFTLRLIEAMARAEGGRFDIEDMRFSLILPSVGDSARESKESG